MKMNMNNIAIVRDYATIGKKSLGNSTCSKSAIKASCKNSSNFISKIILGGLMVLLFSTFSVAQSFDAGRMNRDLKIMENILDEMFKIDGKNNVVRGEFRLIATGSADSFSQGTYIPGYGVIFEIPRVVYAGFTSIEVNKKDGNNNLTFYYDGDDGETKAITQETITNRIVEFLQNYAINIGQLTSQEKIRVQYGKEGKAKGYFVVRQLKVRSDSKKEAITVPALSVSASVSDLNSYRKQQISDKEFKKRLHIEPLETKEFLDLKVMANVFQTAFESEHKLALINKDPKEAFRLMGDVSYQKLDGFGVIFSMNVRYANNSRLSFYELKNIGFDSFDDDKIDKNGNVSINKHFLADSARKAAWQQHIKNAEERSANALVEFKNQLTQYLVDYGRTLRSIRSDGVILLTVEVNRIDRDNLPERIQFQVKKSVLEKFDTGKISRKEAIKAVTISEN